MFAGAVAEGGIVKGMRVPEGKRISNSRVKPKGDVSSEPAAWAGAGATRGVTGCAVAPQRSGGGCQPGCAKAHRDGAAGAALGAA